MENFLLQVRILGPNYVPGSKKDLYVKVILRPTRLFAACDC